jgi:hypothetical protein
MSLLSTKVQFRYFTEGLIPQEPLQVHKLSWSAFGGCDEAYLFATGLPERLISLVDLIRCPVQVVSNHVEPVWWGYINEIIIYHEGVKIKVSLEQLFNRVVVTYSFLSPDNKLGDQYETTVANDTASQAEYGIKETIVHRTNIDDEFADALRDTILKQKALPTSQLSQIWGKTKDLPPYKGDLAPGHSFATFSCKGWFSTLDWLSYENPEGFYANYGPGPGAFFFDTGAAVTNPGQRFLPGANVNLHYVYFQLRKVSGAARTLYCYLRTSAGALIATSLGVSSVGFLEESFTWQRFTFLVPQALVGGTTYMVSVSSLVTHAAQHFAIRTDENENYLPGRARYYTGAAWADIPSITHPGSHPDLMFRCICTSDTGDQIYDIATSGNQFFTRIVSLKSAIFSCPYKTHRNTCYHELTELMKLGTNNDRLILATVDPHRALTFYEQPDFRDPTVSITRDGTFINLKNEPLKPYHPPVGQFSQLANTNRVSLPWDRARLPSCFIEAAEYNDITGKVRVKTIPERIIFPHEEDA